MIEEYFAEVLILVGIINLLIIYFIRFEVRKLTNSLGKVIELNKTQHYELESFLTNLESFLFQLQLQDYSYKVYFQNEVIQERKLQKNNIKYSLNETVSSGEYAVHFQVVPLRDIGEQKDKNKMVFNTLILLIHENLHMKVEAINKKFETISKYHTFILHDTKNITQFFQALSYNIEQAETIKEKEQLLDYLQRSINPLYQKSTKLLKLLELNCEEKFYEDKQKIQLEDLLNSILKLYGLGECVRGKGCVIEQEALLYVVFENVIKNIKDKKEKEPALEFKIEIKYLYEKKISIFFEDNGTKIQNIQKVFEPFYTTKKQGLGIGMYKVRTLLHSINADVELKNDPNATVIITLPLRWF